MLLENSPLANLPKITISPTKDSEFLSKCIFKFLINFEFSNKIVS